MKPPPQAPERPHAEMADWFVRRGQSNWTAADEQAFRAWLRADHPTRLHAWRQWAADWHSLDGLPADAAQRLRSQVQANRAAAAASQPRAGAPSRRRAVAALAAAGLAAAGWAGWQQFHPAPLYQQDFATARGQVSTLTLPDGSLVHLDASTALRARFFHDRREIQLRHGRAAFEEADDAQRPFEVRTADVRITVIGTRFAVRHTPEVPGREGVEVGVAEGRVRVSRTGLGGLLPPWSLEIGAGWQASAAPGAGAAPVPTPLAAAGLMPWRQPALRFSDAPLAQAVAEMQRYADLGIAAIAPAARGLRLSGTFDPRDADGTRRLLAGALPIVLRPGAHGLEIDAADADAAEAPRLR